jgi:hypothetical protein
MPIEPIPGLVLPDAPGKPGGLGEKVEATVQRVMGWLFNETRELLVQIISAGFTLLLEVLERSVASKAGPVIDDILETEGLPGSVRGYLQELRNPTEQGSVIGLGGMAASLGMGAASAMLAPLMRLINYTIDQKVHSARADPATGWRMAWRKPEMAEPVRNGMLALGWDNNYIVTWQDIMRPRLSAGDLFRAAMRDYIPLGAATGELAKQGYLPEDLALIQQLLQQIPGPMDLVSMAVRGAFSPAEISAFGLGAEFPGDFQEWMEKQGFSAEWAQRYWYSHWNLPSLGMGYEMFHRDVIDSATLDLLLKAQDISPFWRGKLREISYAPLTRVDVRRMYGMGVLDRAGVKRSYLDIGYNETNAELMTEFTILFETDADRQATKADILKGFREGMLTEGEARTWLEEIGYTPELAAYLVAQEAAKLERQRTDARVATVKALYIGRELSEPEARSRLTALGLASSEIDAKLTDWSLLRESRTKRPTQSQYDQFLKLDVIDESAYRAGLVGLGYQDQYISWYLDRLLAQKAEDAQEAEKKARSEQQSIRDRKIKSDYQVAKAGLDVDIAELRTAIAEQQIALRVRSARFQQELRIVEQALTRAQLLDVFARDVSLLGADIAGLQEAQALLREQIEGWETATADTRLQEAEYREAVRLQLAAVRGTIEADYGTTVGELEAEAAILEESSNLLRESIDGWQTEAAQIDLQEVQFKEAVRVGAEAIEAAEATMPADPERETARGNTLQDFTAGTLTEAAARARLRAMGYSADVAALLTQQEGAVVQLFEFEQARATLAVQIEQAQDQIAGATTRIDEIAYLVQPASAILEEQEAGLYDFDRQRHLMRVQIEGAQSEIAGAATQIIEKRRAIAEREALLVTQIDLVGRLQTAAALRAEYDRELAEMQATLATMQINLMELQEDKARLAVGYRVGLAA